MKYAPTFSCFAFLAVLSGVSATTGSAVPVGGGPTGPTLAANDAGLLDQHTLDKRTAPALKVLNLQGPAQEKAVRNILEQHFQALASWRQTHDAELKALWSQWADARAPAHKDDSKAADVGNRIDAVYATFGAQHEVMLQQLAAAGLSATQIDAVKDAYTRTPGYQRTYDAYLQIIPNLTDAQKASIREKLLRAREQAMDALAIQEKVDLFKKQKVQIETYLQAQGYDWKTHYAAFVAKIKAESDAKRSMTK